MSDAELTKLRARGMDVDVTKAKFKSEFMKKTYYFCCAPCKEKFEATPHNYMKM